MHWLSRSKDMKNFYRGGYEWFLQMHKYMKQSHIEDYKIVQR